MMTAAMLGAAASMAAEADAPAATPPVLVGLAPSNSSRALPLLGFGTELVWQSTNDTGLLAAAAAAAGSAVARYPGGTPSNYWDWSCQLNGTCCTQRSVDIGETAKCSLSLGQAATTPSAWADFVKPASAETIFDLNVVQTNASYQLAGLRQFAAAGVPIERLELGNELYMRVQAQGAWVDGAGYRAAMEPYLQTLKEAFPRAQLAMIGHEFHGGAAAVAWNQQVFNSSLYNGSSASAGAATVHMYTIVSTGGISNATLGTRAPELLSSAWQWPAAQHGFLERTIPQRYRLWVTEMGHRGRRQWATPEIDGTWLEGLYTGAALLLVLRTARVDVALPYCLVCGLDNAPSFTAGPPWGDRVPPALADKMRWALTPKGQIQADVMRAVSARGGAKSNMTMRALTFSPDRPLLPSLAGTSLLVGWAFVRADGGVDGALLLHLGPNRTALDLSGLVGGHAPPPAAATWQLTARFQPSGPGALLLNMSSVERQRWALPASGIAEVPPYSVVTLDLVATAPVDA